MHRAPLARARANVYVVSRKVHRTLCGATLRSRSLPAVARCRTCARWHISECLWQRSAVTLRLSKMQPGVRACLGGRCWPGADKRPVLGCHSLLGGKGASGQKYGDVRCGAPNAAHHLSPRGGEPGARRDQRCEVRTWFFSAHRPTALRLKTASLLTLDRSTQE